MPRNLAWRKGVLHILDGMGYFLPLCDLERQDKQKQRGNETQGQV